MSITCYVPGTMHLLYQLISIKTSFCRCGNWGLEKSFSITEWTGDWSRILSGAQSLSYRIPLRHSLFEGNSERNLLGLSAFSDRKRKTQKGKKGLAPALLCLSVRAQAKVPLCFIHVSSTSGCREKRRDGEAMGEGVMGFAGEVENKKWSQGEWLPSYHTSLTQWPYSPPPHHFHTYSQPVPSTPTLAWLPWKSQMHHSP